MDAPGVLGEGEVWLLGMAACICPIVTRASSAANTAKHSDHTANVLCQTDRRASLAGRWFCINQQKTFTYQ
jgi:hypothetical protein